MTCPFGQVIKQYSRFRIYCAYCRFLKRTRIEPYPLLFKKIIHDFTTVEALWMIRHTTRTSRFLKTVSHNKNERLFQTEMAVAARVAVVVALQLRRESVGADRKSRAHVVEGVWECDK